MAAMLDEQVKDTEALVGEDRTERTFSRKPWRLVTAAAGLLAATATVGALYHSRSSAPLVSSGVVDITKLVEEEGVPDHDVCETLPFIRLTKVLTSNLGGEGPDKDAEEGLIYDARSYRMPGVPETVEMHVHAMSEYKSHSQKEGEELTPYKAAWPKENGIHGHFAAVNIRQGTNVTLRIHAYDPKNKSDIVLPKMAMTFFDLDTGADGTHSVEFLRVGGMAHYYLTNTTELNVTEEEDGSMLFRATTEGNGDDNPTNPLELTVQQKNRVVSFVFENTDDIQVEMGASAGKTARVFNYVLRPALRCAWTKTEDGNLMASDDPNSPFEIVRGSAHAGGPAFLALALVSMMSFISQQF